MRAVRQYAFGPAENLLVQDVPDPHPGPGQVRIAVAAAGVHLVDTAVRAGTFSGPFGKPALPVTPGREVAGVVDEVGEGVDEDWLGLPVVAHLGGLDGGYAALAVAPEENLHALPPGVSPAGAVAVMGSGRMAIGLLRLAPVTKDDVALVTSAAGGIGTLLVQAAVEAGATVVGLAGGATKVARVAAEGAQVAVDYTEPDWPRRVRAALGDRAVSVAFDGVGGDVGPEVLALLGPAGRLVIHGFSGGAPTPVTTADLLARSLTVSSGLGASITSQPGGLRALEEEALARLAAGHLRPAVTPFSLEDAPAAHRALETRATTGKVILQPTPP